MKHKQKTSALPSNKNNLMFDCFAATWDICVTFPPFEISVVFKYRREYEFQSLLKTNTQSWCFMGKCNTLKKGRSCDMLCESEKVIGTFNNNSTCCCASDEMTSSILLKIPWTFQVPIFIVLFRSCCRRKFCIIWGCLVVFLAFKLFFRVMGCWNNASTPTWRTR